MYKLTCHQPSESQSYLQHCPACAVVVDVAVFWNIHALLQPESKVQTAGGARICWISVYFSARKASVLVLSQRPASVLSSKTSPSKTALIASLAAAGTLSYLALKLVKSSSRMIWKKCFGSVQVYPSVCYPRVDLYLTSTTPIEKRGPIVNMIVG